MLKKISGKNYFVALILLIIIAVLLVVSAFLITVFIPDALGRKPCQYEISSVCKTEPWSIETEDLTVILPSGGTLVTLNETDHDTSLLLLGNGIYRQNGIQQADETIGGLFMVISHSFFDQIRGDILFTPVTNKSELETVYQAVEKQMGIPTIWQDTIPITFYPRDSLIYYYFISPTGEPQLPPRLNASWLSIAGPFMIYSIFVAILMVIMTIFSLDHHYTRYWQQIRETKPGFLNMLMIPLLVILVTAGEVIPKINGFLNYYTFFGYAAAIIVLFVLWKFNKIDYLDFGVRRERIGHGYFLALIAAGLIIGTTRGLPGGMNFAGLETVMNFVLIFLLIGLPREMFWRGFIQTSLCRQYGPNLSLILTVLLVAAARLAIITITETWMIDYPYTYVEAAVLVPGTALVLGFLYQRTENILAGAFLHSIIIFLP
ncbi:MAG: type II CAAX endopeptidase family protein [Bacillota bacterium]|nr:type II CAAX endopeptidase family protein [Bacillota bacterium]